MIGTDRWNITKSNGTQGNGQPHQADAAQPIKYATLTCAELIAAKFELRYLIDNILAEGQPLVIAGAKKTLKTSLLLDLALSLAMAGYFLGYFKVNEGCRVGIMTGESGMPVIQETIVRQSAAAGYDPAQITSLVITDQVPLLADLHHLDALREWIVEHKLRVLIIDPMYLCLGDEVDPANLFSVGKVLRNVSEICQAAGVTLVICHHTKKNIVSPYEPAELEDMAWAGTQEWARQWLLISRRKKYIPGTGVHRLWLSSGGSAGHGGYWGVDVQEGTRATPGGRFWQVDILSPEEARRCGGRPASGQRPGPPTKGRRQTGRRQDAGGEGHDQVSRGRDPDHHQKP